MEMTFTELALIIWAVLASAAASIFFAASKRAFAQQQGEGALAFVDLLVEDPRFYEKTRAEHAQRKASAMRAAGGMQ